MDRDLPEESLVYVKLKFGQEVKVKEPRFEDGYLLGTTPVYKTRPGPDKGSDNEEVDTNLVPIFVFGFTGIFLGAWAGHSIDHKEHMAGEFPEIFTTGTVFGAGIGLAAGATIGYFLGRRK